MEPLLQLEDLHVAYGDLQVLTGVNLVVHAGELVSLLGGNGSGKSTTLRAILGIARAQRGSIRFAGARIDRLATPAIVRRGLTMVPEARRIFPWMTVRENLEMGAWVHRRDRRAVQEDLDRVLTLFPRLRERLGQRGGTLSGGEQQMLAMGRALMLRPQLLLMDEPSMGLAPAVVETVFGLIRTINGSGVGILMVEQNANAALRFTHRAYVLERGVMAIEGVSKELLRHERVRTAYLGELASPPGAPLDGYCHVNGRRIHYVSSGAPTASPVVLLHGQSGFCQDWCEVAPALAQEFRVVALDHPGFGDSDWDPTGLAYTVGGFAADLEQVRAALGLERFVLVGHSFGGRVALAYAGANPGRVRAVVLADSAPDVDPEGVLVARRYLASIPPAFATLEEALAFFRPSYPRYDDDALRRRLALYLAGDSAGELRVKRDPAIGERYRQILAGQAAAPAPDWASLRDAPCPVLLLRGETSALVTPAIVDRMRREHPRLEVVEIPRAGHLVATDQPRDVLAALRRFLARLEA